MMYNFIVVQKKVIGSEIYMSTKDLIKTVRITNDEVIENGNFELEYYLVNTENNIYGIEIQKKQNNLITDVRYVKDIFCSKEQTLKLLKQLAKNKVTPTTFEYVLEDFFGMY